MPVSARKSVSHDARAVLPIAEMKSIRGLKVLVAGVDSPTELGLVSLLTDCGLDAFHATSVPEAMALLVSHDVAMVFCSSELADGTWRDFFRALGIARWNVPVVVAARLGGWEEYLEAMEVGPCDFIVPPYGRAEIRQIVRNALGMASRASA